MRVLPAAISIAAVFHPEDDDYLVDRETIVMHCEVPARLDLEPPSLNG
ncbi:hypothetical protein [Dactylosporangium sp. CA-092794]